ncbi:MULTISPECIES: hypothetical protein [unclassified Bradyrhizobium]|nr:MULTISPECIES: hypothetical protein [unclassified Bradyrhizobium]MBR1205563.1 hypothetical protein [Bradyrhizobium sp. AUGA SZCCT0124]MBR1313988.1 hypothetical protein [Bradyrhizobium sp. AUGA SZCCT0051]MBR1337890.1 hypothetical protein [Bradyrhizobium sp. AUGA SZCCT0105]MBR1360131.1 hypothetical protein [Bradyrhizobium sp. AUGA SZCCT0045]
MKRPTDRRLRYVFAVAAKFSVILTAGAKKFSTDIANEALAIVSDP